MPRRDRVDPQTARIVEERLQRLLSANGPTPEALEVGDRPPPRRSRPEEEGDRVPGSGPGGRLAPADRAEQDHPRARAEPPAGGVLLPLLPPFSRTHLLVVVALVLLALLFGAWTVLRARPVALALQPSTVPPSTAATAGSTVPSAAATPSPQPSVTLHVLGAVRKPGVVSVPAGSRVQDALTAAGGLSRTADPAELNLAQPVSDGQQIVVGTTTRPTGEVRDAGGPAGRAAGGSVGSGGSSTPDTGAAPTVDLNSASQAELEELPGVGPVMAGRIIAWRSEHGRFSRVEELQEIDGVGPKTYAKLAPRCRV